MVRVVGEDKNYDSYVIGFDLSNSFPINKEYAVGFDKGRIYCI